MEILERHLQAILGTRNQPQRNEELLQKINLKKTEVTEERSDGHKSN